MNEMKKYILPLLAAGLMLAACEEAETPHSTLDFSGTLVAAEAVTPAAEVQYDLDGTVEGVFEWTKPSWDGIGLPTVSIAFDEADGDFSTPIASYYVSNPSDSVKILSKDQLKSLHAILQNGTKAKETSCIWAVRTSAGGKTLISEARTIKFKMTPEPDAFKAGNVIYIGGTGFDDPCTDQHLTYLPGIDYGRAKDAAKYPHWYDNDELANNGGSGLKGFDYEVYSRLKAGGTLYLWSGGTKEEPDWYICPEDNAAKTDGVILNSTRTVAKDAHFEYTVKESFLYRIRYNSSTGQITIDNYDKTSKNAKPAGSVANGMTFRYWHNGNPTDNSMTYTGNGHWEIKNITPLSYNGFKFLNFGIAGNSDQPMGCQYVTIYNYGASKAETNDKYWYIGPVQGGVSTTTPGGAPTNGTWTFPSWTVGKALDIAVDLNDTHGAYYLTLDVAE